MIVYAQTFKGNCRQLLIDATTHKSNEHNINYIPFDMAA
jgi:hypothetical protein